MESLSKSNNDVNITYYWIQVLILCNIDIRRWDRCFRSTYISSLTRWRTLNCRKSSPNAKSN